MSNNAPYTSATNFMARVVPENPKCHGCLHYETNKSVCMTALMPATCGSGDSPSMGYAPLSELRPGDGGPTIGAAQAVGATHGPIPEGHDITASPIEVLGSEAPELAAMMEGAAEAHMAKASRTCAFHSFGAASGTVNPSLAFMNKSDEGGCTCDTAMTKRVVDEFYKGLSPRFRYGYTREAVGSLLSSAFTARLEKGARGPGSRGGRILYYSKDGKPIYAGQVAQHATESQQTMENWHQNAKRSGNPEDHAIAAKHSHHAAFFHHHNGDPTASHEAMDTAHHHMGEYNKTGHKSRNTKWVKEHHDATKKLTGWSSPEDNDKVNPHHGSSKRGDGVSKPKHDDTYDIRNFRHGKFRGKKEKAPRVEKSEQGVVFTDRFNAVLDEVLSKSERSHKDIYNLNKSMYGDDWLSPFQGTPFFKEAVALCERDLAIDEQRMKEREKEYDKQDAAPVPKPNRLWLKQDRIAHDKRKLMLKLAQHSAEMSKKRAKEYKKLDTIKSFGELIEDGKDTLIKYVISSAHPPKGASVPHGSVTGVATAAGSNKTTAANNVLSHVPLKGKGKSKGKSGSKKTLKKDWAGGGQTAPQPRSTPQQRASVDSAIASANHTAAASAMADHAARPKQAAPTQMAQKSNPTTFGELFAKSSK